MVRVLLLHNILSTWLSTRRMMAVDLVFSLSLEKYKRALLSPES